MSQITLLLGLQRAISDARHELIKLDNELTRLEDVEMIPVEAHVDPQVLAAARAAERVIEDAIHDHEIALTAKEKAKEQPEASK